MPLTGTPEIPVGLDTVTGGYTAPRSATAPRCPDRRLLVVEDAPDLAELISDRLREIAHEVVTATDGRTALTMIQRDRFDLVVLDLLLPEMSGLEVCRAMRTAGIATPIIMLTGQATELDRIVGLEFGADDYMVKPFSLLELLARSKAVLRRTDGTPQPCASARPATLAVAGLTIEPESRLVVRDSCMIPLTAREFDLLYLFASNPGRVYTRGQLLDLVWGFGSGVYEYTVTSHINRLRQKIELDAENPAIIQTVWGIGYRLQAESSSGR